MVPQPLAGKDIQPAEARVHLVGAASYVGKYILRNLLNRGIAVVVSVRNVNEENALRSALASIITQAERVGRIEFRRHFIESLESWTSVLEIHNDVIFVLNPNHLVDGPLRESHEASDESVISNALKAVDRRGVKRLVVTMHSGESISEYRQNKTPSTFRRSFPGPTLWANGRKLATRNELAGRITMEIADQVAPESNVFAIVPSSVLGRPIGDLAGEELAPIEHILAGNLRFIPDVSISLIDVADLAEISVNALFERAKPGKRDVISASTHTLYLEQVVHELKREFPHLKIPTSKVQKLLLRFLTPLENDVGAVVASVGVHRRIRSERARNILARNPISATESLVSSGRHILGVEILA
jgi:nucleoside-diphosphate-sugar epimerase